MSLGKLGAKGGFGSSGALGKAGTIIVLFFPSLNFSDSRNSQYLAIGII